MARLDVRAVAAATGFWLVSAGAVHVSAQAASAPVAQVAPADGAQVAPQALLETLQWRLVGPFRGGRCAAVVGLAGNRDRYYFGATGGGVWRTDDAGKSWQNVSDGAFGGSIGAIAVAPSDPRVLYVGGGEKTWRGNVGSGDGVWKSLDAGATWEFAGLPDSRHVSRLRVHPQDPQTVYAAVMGHVSGPNEERGVYRTRDGGATWQRVLFVNPHAGAVDLCMAPHDPNVLYATTWRAVRTPWSLESGGEGSGLWQSSDGGDTWQPLHGRPGLPTGVLGISGICVSSADPQRLYAQIEAEAGGLFASDDAGATWRKVNDDRNLRQRAWYYTRVYADPKAKDTVYVLNVQFHKSTDGGKTFTTIRTPHSDNHDLWIDPADPLRMVEGNDGGACVTFDGGKTWSSIDNQPTAQFYRVTTDDSRPYRIYGAQQDNSTVRIAHRGRGPGIGDDEWESTAGGESGWLAPKPGDAEIVFGGSYGGYLVRLDHRTRLSRRVDVWPDNPMGAGAEDLKFRFQWNFPILWSRHERSALYTAAQTLFVSRDEGQSWQAISGDLTRNDRSKMGSSGGPITKDNTSVEYYGTIFTVDEGRVAGTIWTGSDDGLIHVTQDGGQTWRDVTPKSAPEWMQWNCIAASPHGDGHCYVAGTRYKLDDFRPYLYATEDFGATWREIVGGLDPGWFTRCIRPDPLRPGLLYCGTERTVWASFDDGRRWQRFANGLPLVPITDLVVQGQSLIAATQGRAFWSFDGLEHVRQLAPEQAAADVHLYAPVTVVQFPGSSGEVAGQGRNPDTALRVRFHVGGAGDTPVTERVALEVRDPDGEVVFARASDAADEPKRLAVRRGMNAVEVAWEIDGPKILDGMILWNGRGGKLRPAPGEYAVALTFGERTLSTTARIEPDPRTAASAAELQARLRLAKRCRDAVTRAHEAIETIRRIRSQTAAVLERAEGDAKAQLEAQRNTLLAPLTEVEEALYQTKSLSSQDPLNFPIRLTDKLLGVLSAVDRAEFGPTAGQLAVADELIAAIDGQLQRYESHRQSGVAAFNALAAQLAIPYVK